MSSTQTTGGTPAETPEAPGVAMKLEVVVVPVSDVDRAKRFYTSLGWRLDADFATGEEFRVVQVTPPGSECSVIFGKGVTSAVPGSVEDLQLTVFDIDKARDELVGRGVEVSERVPRRRRGVPSRRDRGARDGPGSGARRLRVVRLLQRSGRQRLAAAGDQGASPGTGERRADALRRRGRSGRGPPARGARARRARGADRAGGPGLAGLVRRVHGAGGGGEELPT